MLIRKTNIFVAACAVLLLSSCTTVPLEAPQYPPREITTRIPSIPGVAPTIASPMLRNNVCHIVGPGETLWRISKMYDVDMQKIISENRLRRPNELEMGQRLIIPRAAPIKHIVPLYRSDKWKYIIIHHSATDVGDALRFFEGHKKRGFWRGLGYHFVIDNGTCGKENGQIEVSPRWIKQEDGAHCKASRMNYRGIGVCLVGNFSRGDISEKQLDSLVYLVNKLRRYYDIPTRNIIGHGDVRGASTECPGILFPWRRFWTRINK